MTMDRMGHGMEVPHFYLDIVSIFMSPLIQENIVVFVFENRCDLDSFSL
jgi:hypothetical protein